MHTVHETCPGVWSVFVGDDRRPIAWFEDRDSAELYASMRSIIIDVRNTTGVYHVDALNKLADFAERHHRRIVKRVPGIASSRRAA